MMKVGHLLAMAGVAVLCSGCASGLRTDQKAELRQYEARGQAVQEKHPGLGAALGILPGGGSFYGREYGFGVANLLAWPISILWDPIGGYEASESINYYATKAHVRELHEKEVVVLDEDLKSGQMDMVNYTLQRHKLDIKYNIAAE